MTVWFDVEDLSRFFQSASRPTGIQRLSFETYRAIWRLAGESGDVRFCRRGAARGRYRSIHFPALEAGILAAASAASVATSPVQLSRPGQPSRLALAARRLPLEYRLPLGVIYRSGRAALGGLRELSAAPAKRRRMPGGGVGGHQFDMESPEINFGPGDWFVNLGAPWTSPYDSEFLAGLRARGCGFAMLAHDLIPELFPEWCTESMVLEYDSWLNDIVPQADLMFAVSRNTAADLARCLTQKGKTVPATVLLPVGSCMTELTAGSAILETPYVLMVGTIEARKNHGAMMRVWRRLLETMEREQVPDLVFAGKIGWLTADLMQQLTNANWFGGKIRFIDSPSETLLANLYKHCAFTVFPSLYEGWGLPVTESLCFGKTVVASNRAAIPEAGGSLCAYFDPDNALEAYEIIRGMIEHPERVAALEARIAAEFHCPNWDGTAAAVLARFGIEELAAAERVGVRSIG